MECVQGQSSRKTCCDCDLLLISAAHGWPNMIKVCAVSLKTHLSSVDLNSLYLQASEKWKTVYPEEFVVAGIRGSLSRVKGCAADCHLEKIKSKLKAVVSRTCERGSGSWISLLHTVLMFLESSKHRYICRAPMSIKRLPEIILLFQITAPELKWKLSTETIFLLVGAFKTPPTSEICWLAAENVSVMRSLMPLCSSPQILKKSCIEILAAEPSSICAGGKTREIYI